MELSNLFRKFGKLKDRNRLNKNLHAHDDDIVLDANTQLSPEIEAGLITIPPTTPSVVLSTDNNGLYDDTDTPKDHMPKKVSKYISITSII